jgi:hypothetical protein
VLDCCTADSCLLHGANAQALRHELLDQQRNDCPPRSDDADVSLIEDRCRRILVDRQDLASVPDAEHVVRLARQADGDSDTCAP